MMKLSRHILKELIEKEVNRFLLLEVSYEDAKRNLEEKSLEKIVKAYMYDHGISLESGRDVEYWKGYWREQLLMAIPHDIEDKQKGLALLWLIRLAKKSKNNRYEIENYMCWCGRKATHIAHRIAATKTNYKVYGKEIIDHWFNLCCACGVENGRHNDLVNIGNKPATSKKLLQLIKTRGDELLTVKEINEYLEV